MNLVKNLEEWKSALEELSVEKGRAEGKLDQAMDELRKLGFSSIEDAKAELDRLEKKKAELESEAAEMLKTFEEKYKEFLA